MALIPKLCSRRIYASSFLQNIQFWKSRRQFGAVTSYGKRARDGRREIASVV